MGFVKAGRSLIGYREQVLKPKHKFKTDKEAITEAKRINLLPYTIHKFVAYKCNKCSNYHIGKTNKEINK